jgi:hypothetical protein
MTVARTRSAEKMRQRSRKNSLILSRLAQSQALISSSSRAELLAKRSMMVAVERRVAEADPGGDVLDGQRLQPALADDAQGGGDDVLLSGRDFLHAHFLLVSIH